jgi:hypothetical protein
MESRMQGNPPVRFGKGARETDGGNSARRPRPDFI